MIVWLEDSLFGVIHQPNHACFFDGFDDQWNGLRQGHPLPFCRIQRSVSVRQARQNAAYRRAPDPSLRGYFCFRDTGATEFADLSRLQSGGHRPTLLFATLRGVDQASAGSFPQYLPFELRDACRQACHCAPGGSGEVEGFSQRHEPIPRCASSWRVVSKCVTDRPHHEAFGLWILFLAHGVPPSPDGFNGKRCGIVINTHAHPPGILCQVADTVGRGAPKFRNQKIMYSHLLRIAARSPSLAAILKSPTSSFFLVSTEITAAGGPYIAALWRLYAQTAHCGRDGCCLLSFCGSLADYIPFHEAVPPQLDSSLRAPCDAVLPPASLRRCQATVDRTTTLRRLRPAGVPVLAGYQFGEYADRFWREVMGAGSLETIDASECEGATIIHDLNRDVPPELHEKFDVVVEAGSLEHIFYFPVAIANLMKMVRVGGTVFLTTIANNLCGHGFYQFSPELIYRVFSPENGFEGTKVVFLKGASPSVELSPITRSFEVADPKVVGGRVGLQSKTPILMMVESRKTRQANLFGSTPQQSDYVTAWQKTRASSEASQSVARSLVRSVAKTLPQALLRKLECSRLTRLYSLANRRFYRAVP
jgi:hypothetical protein